MNAEYLHTKWSGLGPAFQTPAGESVFAGLQKLYSAKRRHYHNTGHIANMFRLFDRYAHRMKRAELVAHAIFWHDAVYRPARKDNEFQSAKMAAEKLSGFGVNPRDVAYIQEFILATQHHQLPPDAHADLPWLLDFDLSILGAEWPDYETYTQQIRREYSIYPDMLYRPGRRKALEQFMIRPVIYLTAEFREALESRARANIAREIAAL